MQCYDAFGLSTPEENSSSSDDGYSSTFVICLTLLLSLATLVLGFFAGYYMNAYHTTKKSQLQTPLLPTVGEQSSHPLHGERDSAY
jgi:ABC-type phosphate transport system permease subunit